MGPCGPATPDPDIFKSHALKSSARSDSRHESLTLGTRTRPEFLWTHTTKKPSFVNAYAPVAPNASRMIAKTTPRRFDPRTLNPHLLAATSRVRGKCRSRDPKGIGTSRYDGGDPFNLGRGTAGYSFEGRLSSVAVCHLVQTMDPGRLD